MTTNSESGNSRKFHISLTDHSLPLHSLSISTPDKPPVPEKIVASYFTLEEAYIAMEAVETISRKFGKVENSIRDITLTVTENGSLRYFGDVGDQECNHTENSHFSNWYRNRHEILKDKTKRTVYQIALPDVVFNPTGTPPLVPVPEGEIDPDSLLTFYETLEDAIVAQDAITAMHKKVGGLVGHVNIIIDTDPGRFYTRIYPDPEMNGEEMKPDTKNLSRYDPDDVSTEIRPDIDDLPNDSSADGPAL